MGTQDIRAQIQKIKALIALQKKLLDTAEKSAPKEKELIITKLKVTREEMLKSTYSIGKLLKDIEEKV